MGKHHKVPVTALAIVTNGDEVLVMRRAPHKNFGGMYTIPGGHMEQGETPVEAAVRELKEETSLSVLIDENMDSHAQVVGVLHSAYPKEYIFFVVRMYGWHGSPRIMEPDSCDDMRWVNAFNLPETMQKVPRLAVQNFLRGKVHTGGIIQHKLKETSPADDILAFWGI